jgi:hypothetical protein
MADRRATGVHRGFEGALIANCEIGIFHFFHFEGALIAKSQPESQSCSCEIGIFHFPIFQHPLEESTRSSGSALGGIPIPHHEKKMENGKWKMEKSQSRMGPTSHQLLQDRDEKWEVGSGEVEIPISHAPILFVTPL